MMKQIAQINVQEADYASLCWLSSVIRKGSQIDAFKKLSFCFGIHHRLPFSKRVFFLAG